MVKSKRKVEQVIRITALSLIVKEYIPYLILLSSVTLILHVLGLAKSFCNGIEDRVCINYEYGAILIALSVLLSLIVGVVFFLVASVLKEVWSYHTEQAKKVVREKWDE